METGFPKQLQCLKLGQSQNTEAHYTKVKAGTSSKLCQGV